MFLRKLSLGVAAAALMVGSAAAADLFVPTTPDPIVIPPSMGFNWEGFYAGVQGGALFSRSFSGATGGLPAGDRTRGIIGATAGVNFIPVDPILLGVEARASYVFPGDFSSSSTARDDAGLFLALARVGAVVTDEVVVYAAGGAGVSLRNNETRGVYALGGGVDFAVTNEVSLRGEVLGLGEFDRGGNNDFFSGAQATVGVFYHF